MCFDPDHSNGGKLGFAGWHLAVQLTSTANVGGEKHTALGSTCTYLSEKNVASLAGRAKKLPSLPYSSWIWPAIEVRVVRVGERQEEHRFKSIKFQELYPGKSSQI